MDSTQVKNTNPPKHFWLGSLLIVGLLCACVSQIMIINVNNVLFQGSSNSMFLLSSSLMMLLSLLPFKITDQYQLKFALIICFIVAVFLGYQYTFDIPTSNSAMLLPIWSQLFFLSRPVAVGFGIAACVGYLLQSRNKDYHLDNHCHMLSLLAGTAFLVGEVAGNFWAFLGWGKSWGWTGHFYVSALTYLLLVLVFHLPKAWFNSASRLALGKAVLLGFICLLILGYKFS